MAGGERSATDGDTLIATMAVDGTSDTVGPSASLPRTGPGGEGVLLERGDAVGRYVVLARLGQGGMGVVYAAYDPELDRKVAIKLVLARRDEDPTAHVRLLREAQAMAQLAHPNVVTVHDVGTLGDRVWIAMEFVEGVTLGEWLGDRPRPWPEVLAVFMRAGEGLQRAHAAGLVHRDFKPDNVMISPDGRVRVMDFGLARTDRAPTRELPRLGGAGLDVPAESAVDPALTNAGELLGTPRYMAPEQWHRQSIDARTDQFAFCVALWEALYGVSPFRGQSILELATAVTLGQVELVRSRRKVPSWLHRVLQRGLMPDPDQRFPSLEALLRAVQRRQAGTRSRRLLLALAAVLVVVAGALLWQRGRQQQRVAACEAAGAEIDAVWNDETRASLRAALLATGGPYAASSADRMVPWVDRWTAQWRTSRAQVCVEELAGTRTPQHAAHATACLGDRRDELTALLAVLATADADVLPYAVPAVAGLSLLAPCSERAALERRPAPPADSATHLRVQELRRDLMGVHGLFAAGRYTDGLARAQALHSAAEVVGYPPLIAEAGAAVGRLANRAGDSALAERSLAGAFIEGGAIGTDEVAATAAVDLVFVVGVTGQRSPEALQWAQAADMLVRRLGQDRGLLGATLLNNRGIVHAMRGAYDEALDCLQRALEIRVEVLGPDHPRVGDSLGNLGEIHRLRGDYDEAIGVAARVLTLNEGILGPDHPDIAIALNNLAVAYLDRHDPDPALPLLLRASAIWEQTHGHAHPNIANVLNNLANAHALRGEYEQALAANTEALALWEKLVGVADSRYAYSLGRRADILHYRGQEPEALAEHLRALATLEKAFGPDHPELGAMLGSVAGIHLAMGAPELALPLTVRAVALSEQARGPSHPLVLAAHVLHAMALLDLGRAGEALPELERTVAAFVPGRTEPVTLAEARFALARALVAVDSPDHARARELADAAAVTLRAAGPVHASRLREVDEWRRAHGD